MGITLHIFYNSLSGELVDQLQQWILSRVYCLNDFHLDLLEKSYPRKRINDRVELLTVLHDNAQQRFDLHRLPVEREPMPVAGDREEALH